uniref:alcohol dehydrogenase catalytic domain-containing protein n=1 Tax=Acetobacter malorum TaxID=178901 RepID=UPI00248DFA4C
MSDETNTVIRVHETGGPDVLKVENLPVPMPGSGEVLLRQEAIGGNFIDTYFRSGLYKFPSLPAIPGMEGAGVIEAVGPDVTDLQPGMRVASAGVRGGYAQSRPSAAGRLVVLPANVSCAPAA